MDITVWERQIKNKNGEFVWEFNHISNGFDGSEKPTPKFAEQNGWLKANWRGTKAALLDGKVIK